MKMKDYLLVGAMLAASVNAEARPIGNYEKPVYASQETVDRLAQRFNRYVEQEGTRKYVSENDSLGILDLAANVLNMDEISKGNYKSIKRLWNDVADLVQNPDISKKHPDISKLFCEKKDELSDDLAAKTLDFVNHMAVNAKRHSQTIEGNRIGSYTLLGLLLVQSPPLD